MEEVNLFKLTLSTPWKYLVQEPGTKWGYWMKTPLYCINMSYTSIPCLCPLLFVGGCFCYYNLSYKYNAYTHSTKYESFPQAISEKPDYNFIKFLFWMFRFSYIQKTRNKFQPKVYPCVFIGCIQYTKDIDVYILLVGEYISHDKWS